MNKKPKVTYECSCLKYGVLRSACRGPQGCQADRDREAYKAYLESKKSKRWVWKKQ
jgi:hypothetical protein